jgi:integrase
MAKALTVAAVERYKGGKKRREIRDSKSYLLLLIQPSGYKSWIMRFRRPDADRTLAKLTLGPVDMSGVETKLAPGMEAIGTPLTLAAARALAAEVQRQRKLGRDVIADVQVAKRHHEIAVEEGATNTWGALVLRFMAEHAQKKTRRWPAQARLLGLRYPKDGGEPEVIPGGLCARWANKPVREIKDADIWSVVDETKRLGTPGLERRADGPSDNRARAMHSALSTCFGWLADHRKVDRNPCAGVKAPGLPEARDRVLSETEIQKLWNACDKVGEPFSQLLKLLLLTGCRLNEVAGMRRSELHNDGIWQLPGKRTKNKKPHVMPLPPLAQEIIASVKRIAGEAGFVFTTTGQTPISGWSKIKHRLDAEMQIPDWRIHDLRRTCATGMAEISIAPHIVEAVLNHVSGARAGVAGVYNRAAYAPEKKNALERWASHIAGLVSEQPGAKVLSMKRKAKR